MNKQQVKKNWWLKINSWTFSDQMTAGEWSLHPSYIGFLTCSSVYFSCLSKKKNKLRQISNPEVTLQDGPSEVKERISVPFFSAGQSMTQQNAKWSDWFTQAYLPFSYYSLLLVPAKLYSLLFCLRSLQPCWLWFMTNYIFAFYNRATHTQTHILIC